MPSPTPTSDTTARTLREGLALLADPRPSPARREAAVRWIPVLERHSESFLALVEENSVAPLVALRLLQQPDAVSANLLAWARVARDRAVFRELAERRLLGQVLAALAAEDVRPPVLLKGAGLRETHYPEPWLRPMADADLLVRPSEEVAAARALARLGFFRRPLPETRSVSGQAWPAMTYAREGAPLRVDLHLELHRDGRYRPDGDGVRRRARRVQIDGAPAALPDRIDALLITAVHAAELGGRGAFKRHVDLGIIVRRGGFSWMEAVGRAHRWRCAAALRGILALAAETTDVAPPPYALEALGAPLRSRIVGAMMAARSGQRFTNEPLPRPALVALRFLLPDGNGDRTRFALRYMAWRLADSGVAGARRSRRAGSRAR